MRIQSKSLPGFYKNLFIIAIPIIIQQLMIVLDGLSSMYGPKDGNICGIPYRMTYLPDDCVLHRTAIYESSVDMPFEVTTVPVPVGYDEYLKQNYGADYMTPAIYPAHDYPFFKDQMNQLKNWLAANGSSLEAFGIPDLERTDLSDF